jgi:tetratricopeptide (TPR) repeat protein
VYAIGSPEGLELTFSEGVISALRDTEGVRMVQTSAAISPGSSGGGLFDAQGNLVGVTTFYLKEGQSLNFALPGEWVSGTLAASTEAVGKSSARLGDAGLESRAWMGIGLEAVKKEDYGLATHSFRMCADLKQLEAPQAWLELGELAEKATHLDSASEAYRNWFLTLYGSWPPKEVQRKLQERAVAAFEKAIELKTGYAEGWLALARVYSQRQEYDQAISSAKEATRLAPGDLEGWTDLAMLYVKTGFYPEARTALQRAEKIAPSDRKVGVLVFAGIEYGEMSDREQVMRIYQELKVTDPKAAEWFFKACVLPHPDDDWVR